jgi:hypothetical protein
VGFGHNPSKSPKVQSPTPSAFTGGVMDVHPNETIDRDDAWVGELVVGGLVVSTPSSIDKLEGHPIPET